MNATEKEIVAWLRNEAHREGLAIYRGTMWKAMLHAIFRPAKFGKELGRFWALVNAANDIEFGVHRQHSPAKDD